MWGSIKGRKRCAVPCEGFVVFSSERIEPRIILEQILRVAEEGQGKIASFYQASRWQAHASRGALRLCNTGRLDDRPSYFEVT